MASIHRLLAAFARNLEAWTHLVKQLSQHIRITRLLKNDVTVAIWCIKRAAEHGMTFDQFLKPIDVSDVILCTHASSNVGRSDDVISRGGDWGI